MFLTMLQNRWTTILGATLATLYYLQSTGAKFPVTKQEWMNLIIGVGIAALGFVAKDATTGSVPPAARLLVAVVLLTGCAGASAYGTIGTPEELRELRKIKDAVSVCTVINTPWGPQRSSAVSIDKGLTATVSVDDQCKQTLTVTQPAPPSGAKP